MSIKVNIDKIPESGKTFDENMPREWLDNIPEFTDQENITHIRGQIHLQAKVSLEGKNLRLKGRIQATLHTICSRCAEEIDWTLDSKMDLTLMPGAPPPVEEEEHELSRQELEQLYYRGPVVELDEYFKQQIALDLPIKFLCSEACRGLCPRCGVNLNVETCQCRQEEGDPRLAVLRNLKIKK